MRGLRNSSAAISRLLRPTGRPPHDLQLLRREPAGAAALGGRHDRERSRRARRARRGRAAASRARRSGRTSRAPRPAAPGRGGTPVAAQPLAVRQPGAGPVVRTAAVDRAAPPRTAVRVRHRRRGAPRSAAGARRPPGSRCASPSRRAPAGTAGRGRCHRPAPRPRRGRGSRGRSCPGRAGRRRRRSSRSSAALRIASHEVDQRECPGGLRGRHPVPPRVAQHQAGAAPRWRRRRRGPRRARPRSR